MLVSFAAVKHELFLSLPMPSSNFRLIGMRAR